ncbi:MAG: hypothetical protein RLZZ135_1585 [Cyanobacteriota bacterium]|jgi:hypothetical protein
MRYKVSIEFDLLEDPIGKDIETLSHCLDIVEELFKNIQIYSDVKKKLFMNVDPATIEPLSFPNYDSN